MDRKEKHVRENKGAREALIADSLPAKGKENKNNSTIRTNKLWMWHGLIVLIFILRYWLFAIGTFGDLMDWFNG